MSATNLGNLSYSIDLEDKTGPKLQSIINELKKIDNKSVTVNVVGDAEAKIKSLALALASVQNANVTVTCNQSSLNALLTSLRTFLNGKKVYVNLTPSVKNSDLNDMKMRLESKLKQLKLQNVQLNVDRRLVQQQLNAAPFKADVELNVKQMQVQKAIQQAFNAYGMNWNGLTSAQARMVRSNQQQQRQDDLHAESLLRQQKLQQQLNGSTQEHLSIQRNLGATLSTSQNAATMLGNALGQAFSVYAIKNFLSEIISVGGELEKQRLAMQAIIGNASEANDIYGKLKRLSMISPFDVQDLVKYTKQLSAFGIQYSDLYETSKRLSDIAAGVGVNFSRIAYEYGQTSARGWLDGRELRMFANSGIPLLEKLAKKYSDLRNEIVTTSEVRKMVTNREVSFADVKDVLWTMTNEGGEFYQMQEVMAESLAAKWRNLANAWNLMLGNMAEDGAIGGALKGTAEILTTFTQNWQMLSAVLPAVLAKFVYGKMALMQQNAVLGQNVVSVKQNVLAQKELEAQELRRIAATRNLTIMEAQRLANSKKILLSDYQRMVANKQITTDEAARALAFSRAGREMASLGVRYSITQMRAMGFTKDQMRYVLTMTRSSAATRAAAQSVLSLGNAFKTAGNFIKSNWLMFAATAVFELWAYLSQTHEEYNSFVKDMAQKGKDGYKEIAETMESMKDFDVSSATEKEVKSAIDTLKEAVKEFDATWEETFADIFSTDDTGNYARTVEEQFDALNKRLKETQEVYEFIQNNGNIAADAVNATKGLFNESFVTNANDWHKALQKVSTDINNMKGDDIKKSYEDLFTVINKLSETSADGVRKQWAELKKKISEASSDTQKYKLMLTSGIIEQLKGTKEDMDRLSHQLGGEFGNLHNLKTQRIELNGDTKQLAESIEKAVSKYFNRQEKPGQWEASVIAMLKAVLDKTDLTEAERDILENDVRRTLNIDVITHYKEQAATTDLQKTAYEALGLTGVKGKDGKVEYEDKNSMAEADYIKKVRRRIKNLVSASQDENDLYKKLKEKRDEAQDYIDKFMNPEDAGKDYANRRPKDTRFKDQFDEYKEQLRQVEVLRSQFGMNFDKIKEKSAGSGDPYKKSLQEDIRLVKEAYHEYRKWYDLYGDEQKAIGMVGNNPLFQDKDGKAMFGNPEDIKGNYKSLLEKIGEAYPDLKRQIHSEIFNFDSDEAKKSAAEAVTAVKEQMDRDTKDWNLYKKLFDATGNRQWSRRIALENPVKVLWDEQTSELREKYNMGNVLDWTLDETEAKRFFNSDALVAQYMELKKRIEENYINFWGDFAETKKGLQSIEQQITAVQEKRKKALGDAMGAGVSASELEQIARDFDDQISALEFDKLKSDLNWEALLGSSTVIEKDFLKSARNAMRKFRNSKEWANMSPLNQKNVLDAIDKMDEAISRKGGVFTTLFGGLAESGRKYKDASRDVETAQMLYNKALISGTEEEKARAKAVLDSAKASQYAAKLNQWKTKQQVAGNLTAIANASAALGKETERPLQAIGSAISSIGSALGESGSLYSGIVGAIFTLLDAIGDDFGGFVGNIGENVLHAVGGIKNAIGSIFGISDLGGIFKEADYRAYDEMLTKFKDLEDVWATIIEAKKQYINESWGAEANNAAEETKRLIEADMNVKKALAKLRLESGASAGSHSIDYRMWEGSYKSIEGRVWKDVAGQISKTFGVSFSGMEDLLTMSGETLTGIREQYADLWAAMDGDFRSYLEDIIDYDKRLEDVNESLQERITQTSFDTLRQSFVDTLMDMSSSAADFADDFSKLMMNAMVNNHLLGSSFDKWLESWWEEMSAAVEAGDMEAQNRLNESAQKKREELLEERDRYAAALNYKGDSASSSLSSGIKGVTEQTADILASYVNAIRADVSVDRTALESISYQQLPLISATAQAQLTQLEMVAQHTYAIMQSNDHLAVRVDELADDVRAVTNGIKKFSIQ